MRFRAAFLLLSLSSVCAAAVAQPTGGVSAPPSSSGGPAVATGAATDDYELGVTDKLRVLIYDEPNLSGEFVVGTSGTLSLPLIGEVVARGRPLGDVRKEIESRLADGYLREPRVSLEVLSFRPYYILGEVSKPGEYAFSSGLTVLNAVATAQGFTYRANKRRVFLKRAGETEEKEIKLTSDLKVSPGDTIRIGERYF